MALLNEEIENFEKDSTEKTGNSLSFYVDDTMKVGDLLSLDYSEAVILVHDALRQDVKGLPMGCFLLATRIIPETKLKQVMRTQYLSYFALPDTRHCPIKLIQTIGGLMLPDVPLILLNTGMLTTKPISLLSINCAMLGFVAMC